MAIGELKNKLIAVLGFGQEGEATTAYLIKHGIKPVLFDQKPWDQWPKDRQDKIKAWGVNFIFGPDAFLELKGFDVIFRSPGISLAKIPKFNSDIQITSQTKFFFENCPAKIIGVTGTKGKGTTATLIFEMLFSSLRVHPKQSLGLKGLPRPSDALGARNDKDSVYLTGNIGKVQPLEILDNLTANDWVVYELSSFQLQDLDKSPHIGVVLMTTSEHLDYHKDESEYVEAKSAIIKYQGTDDIAIINADYQNSGKIGRLGQGKKLFFSRQRTQGDCYVENNILVLKNSDFQFNLSELGLVGSHNYENACAAVLAAKSAGCADEAIKKILREFKGLKHRLEFVAEKNGIKFYNDSFSTTPETAIAAIKAFFEPEVLILGGSSKKSDFSQLIKQISITKNLKTIILIGQEATKLKELLSNQYTGQVLEGAKNLNEVFDQIKNIAESGDVVLFSPACASFDWFKNYIDRGEQFINLVSKFN